jgi:hypothetical protein
MAKGEGREATGDWRRAAVGAALMAAVAVSVLAQSEESGVASRVMKLTRDSAWTSVTSIPIRFRTFHPQGMVKIGDTFYVSSVEVTTPTTRFAAPVEGKDRDAGAGVGHLFKIDGSGSLVADLRVGEGTIYHPGGIDYDGQNIWVPVAEYRPNSRSIVYRVDPQTMKASEVFRFNDHIGAVVHDTGRHLLAGVSWGSRRFYRWPLTRDGRVTDPDADPATLATPNPSHYVDYQDCKYAGNSWMLCTGVTELRRGSDAAPFRLGGMDLVDLTDGRPRHQVPILLWTDDGLDMTHNPAWIEATAQGLRGYFMPEDERSTIYVYEVRTE